MSQSRENEREAVPAREEVREETRDETPKQAEAAYARAVAGIYAAARGAGRVSGQQIRQLAGVIGNQAMLRLVDEAAGPAPPVIPDMDAPAPVSFAECVSAAPPEFI